MKKKKEKITHCKKAMFCPQSKSKNYMTENCSSFVIGWKRRNFCVKTKHLMYLHLVEPSKQNKCGMTKIGLISFEITAMAFGKLNHSTSESFMSFPVSVWTTFVKSWVNVHFLSSGLIIAHLCWNCDCAFTSNELA